MILAAEAWVGVIGAGLGAVVGGGVAMLVERQNQRHELRVYWRREGFQAVVDAEALIMTAMDAAGEGRDLTPEESRRRSNIIARFRALGANDLADGFLEVTDWSLSDFGDLSVDEIESESARLSIEWGAAVSRFLGTTGTSADASG